MMRATLLLLGLLGLASTAHARSLLQDPIDGCPVITQSDVTAFNNIYKQSQRAACFEDGVVVSKCRTSSAGLCKVSCYYAVRKVCPSDRDVLALFDSWNAALATLDPTKVAAMYAPNGVLLPTVSNDVRTTPAEILDYFVKFLKNKPQGKIDEYEIRHLAEGVVANMGIYTFTMGASGAQVQARYTYVYKRQANGKWLIAEHHSSAMPENTVQEVEAAFDAWNAALQTGEPSKVADMYAADAVLLPTVSNKVRNTREKIIDYFTMFLKKKPYGKIDYSNGNSPNIRILASGVAINSGTYVFDLTDEKTGVTSKVGARYTYVYQKMNGKWMIVEHHSSALPEPVTA